MGSIISFMHTCIGTERHRTLGVTPCFYDKKKRDSNAPSRISSRNGIIRPFTSNFERPHEQVMLRYDVGVYDEPGRK